jgi:hypothetical protein
MKQEANMFAKPPLSPAVVLTLQEMSLVKMLKEVVSLLKEGKYVFLVVGTEEEQDIVKRMIGNNQLYPYLQYLSITDISVALKHLNLKTGVMNVNYLGNNEAVTVTTKSVLHCDHLNETYLSDLFQGGKDYVIVHHSK